jgi:hypothetical protein
MTRRRNFDGGRAYNGMMPLVPHRFAAIVAMLAILGAQAACACHAMGAAVAGDAAAAQAQVEAATETSPHACCQHSDDANGKTGSQPLPEKSPDGCRHCSGELKAAPSRPAGEAANAGAAIQPALIAPVERALLSTQSSQAEFPSDLRFPHATSLLRLHCALNL